MMVFYWTNFTVFALYNRSRSVAFVLLSLMLVAVVCDIEMLQYQNN